MHAVINHLQFNKAVDEFKEIVQDNGIPVLSKYPGFIDFHFVKVDESKAIVLIIWENEASAISAAKAFGPSWFDKHFSPFLVGEEKRSMGEIIASAYTR